MGKRLILNADDLGYDPAVTRGILEAMRQGVVSSTTFMVNMPSSAEAAREAKGLAVGLHLNLARERPVWPRFPAPLLRPDGGLDEARAGALPAEVVEQEALAQLERLEALLGAGATHVDVHKHLHQHPAVLDGLAAAARAKGLPVRSINPGMRARLGALGVRTNPHFIGDAGAEAYWTLPRLREQLEALPDGVTELMCHPGYAPQTLRSGYSAQREVELATFVHPEARRALAELGVQVVDFRAL